MNPVEENSTNWWLKFVSDSRKYDIIIRNFNHKQEFDVIGIRFINGLYESDPWLENVEVKITKQGHTTGAVNKVLKQARRKLSFGGFNRYLIANNSKDVLNSVLLPKCLGKIYIEENNKNYTPKAQLICDPSDICSLNYKNRETLLKTIRQFYSRSRAFGLPCLFAKCNNSSCSLFYPFKMGVPPPDYKTDNKHSGFCYKSSEKAYAYIYGSTDVTIGNYNYCYVRFNKMIRF